MVTRYDICPVCGKKGIWTYINRAGTLQLSICRYCKSSWEIKEWNDGRWKDVPDEIIAKRIEQNKRAIERKK